MRNGFRLGNSADPIRTGAADFPLQFDETHSRLEDCHLDLVWGLLELQEHHSGIADHFSAGC